MTKSTILLFLFLSLNMFAQINRSSILGKWISTDKTVAVQVYQQGKDYKAKLIWIDEKLGSGTPIHTRVDSRNPDPKLRTRKIIGMDILEGLHYNAEKERWEKGKIYDASTGRIWDTYAELDAKGRLYVRGYWKFTWIGKALHFTRF